MGCVELVLRRAYRHSFVGKASVFPAVAYTQAVQMEATDPTLRNPKAVASARPAALSGESRRAALISGCIVGFAYSANYTNHAPLAPARMREFGFNQTLAGLLTTGIFATHAGMQIPGGHLVDRLGAKRVLLCALVWVALGNLAMAFAGAYWQLLCCQAFTGL